jgi:hypothetical protein
VLQLLQLLQLHKTIEGVFTHFLKDVGQSNTTKELALGECTFSLEKNSKIHILKKIGFPHKT